VDLERVEFLDLAPTEPNCAADSPILTIDVTLAAGANHIARDLACGGPLEAVGHQIEDLSGFTAWLATQ
jgi:hypothetical protein